MSLSSMSRIWAHAAHRKIDSSSDQALPLKIYNILALSTVVQNHILGEEKSCQVHAVVCLAIET